MPADTSLGENAPAVPHHHYEGNDDFTRLHITPFDSELLKIVLPPSILLKAQNLSFHTIETFPEKRYGFVDLPKADAEKIKKKLNGAVLKGAKMRIDKAKEETRENPHGEEVKKEKKDKKPKDATDKSKKRKRDAKDNVVDGIALTDRIVKRGWTEVSDHKEKKKARKDKSDKDAKDAKDKKRKEKSRLKSRYTEGEECLFKTKVPSNATKYLPNDDATRKKKRKGNLREVTVHEFEKTTKFPTFLKNSAGDFSRTAAKEFVKGKGWVDEEGNVVEIAKEEKVSLTKILKAKLPKTPSKKRPVVQEEDSDDTSSSGTSSDESSDEGSSDDTPKKPVTAVQNPEPAEQTTPKAEVSRPVSSSSSRSLTIKIPPPEVPSDNAVHPLEALYKRKKPDEGTATATTPAKEAEPFSFFGSGGEIEEDDTNDNDDDQQMPPMPMTPFTRQDLEWRTIRSAAPTPDTAHPSRVQWLPHYDDEDVDDLVDLDADDDEDEGEEKADKGKASAESDFQSWFWENRRDLNKSWMTRRKTAAKEKRHRENKARASRAV